MSVIIPSAGAEVGHSDTWREALSSSALLSHSTHLRQLHVFSCPRDMTAPPQVPARCMGFFLNGSRAWINSLLNQTKSGA